MGDLPKPKIDRQHERPSFIPSWRVGFYSTNAPPHIFLLLNIEVGSRTKIIWGRFCSRTKYFSQLCSLAVDSPGFLRTVRWAGFFFLAACVLLQYVSNKRSIEPTATIKRNRSACQLSMYHRYAWMSFWQCMKIQRSLWTKCLAAEHRCSLFWTISNTFILVGTFLVCTGDGRTPGTRCTKRCLHIIEAYSLNIRSSRIFSLLSVALFPNYWCWISTALTVFYFLNMDCNRIIALLWASGAPTVDWLWKKLCAGSDIETESMGVMWIIQRLWTSSPGNQGYPRGLSSWASPKCYVQYGLIPWTTRTEPIMNSPDNNCWGTIHKSRSTSIT